MPKPAAIDPQKFVEIWKQTGGSQSEVGKILGRSPSSIGNTRQRIEKLLGITLHASAPNSSRNAQSLRSYKSPRTHLDIEDGMVIVGGDAHRWRPSLTTAERAFIKFVKEFKPRTRILNGDLFDGASISRHGRIQWDVRPSVKEELDAVKSFTDAVEDASGRTGDSLWNWGNHCMRYSTKLASMVPEYAGVPGLALQDHFPVWKFQMAVFINDDVVVKHRWHSGVHARHQNALKSGRTLVTNHLHNPGVTRWTDYNGTRYGVDTGCLADPDGPQFDYGEENPHNHQSGFAVLTFHKGKLLMPELVLVRGPDEVEFRGKVWTV